MWIGLSLWVLGRGRGRQRERERGRGSELVSRWNKFLPKEERKGRKDSCKVWSLQENGKHK